MKNCLGGLCLGALLLLAVPAAAGGKECPNCDGLWSDLRSCEASEGGCDELLFRLQDCLRENTICKTGHLRPAWPVPPPPEERRK